MPGYDRLCLALQDPNLGKMFNQGAYLEGPMGAPPLSQAEVPHASAGPAAGMQAGGLCNACKVVLIVAFYDELYRLSW